MSKTEIFPKLKLRWGLESGESVVKIRITKRDNAIEDVNVDLINLQPFVLPIFTYESYLRERLITNYGKTV